MDNLEIQVKVELFLIIVYGLFLAFIFSYSLIQLQLALAYRKVKNRKAKEVALPEDFSDWPVVTVQLPVFNELYVVERLIESVSQLDYPKDKLEIQVLDDSTDESFELAAKKVEEVKACGIDIKHIKRPDRVGFKAGALAYGLEICRGEFTAIFDADFVPTNDFLKKTIPAFANEKVGLVQTRWEHLNKDFSWLTKMQAFGLDAHFTVEQSGRNSSGHFINFNGTAGVWRKTCIEQAGGWQSDTLTEDLDLSYRAQLNGWKFVYKQEVGSPAELPAEMNALKNQQFRWTKGAAECAVKNLPKVLRGKNIDAGTKIHAIFHLLNSGVFICILCSALLSIPMLFIKSSNVQYSLLFNLASIFLISFFILSYFYWVSMEKGGRGWWSDFKRFAIHFPMFLSISMGMSLHNTVAVIEGYIGKKTPFIRTPKFAIGKTGGNWSTNKYRSLKVSPLAFVEGLLTVYFVFGIVLAFKLGDYGMLPFHLMLTLGFGYVFFYSVKHSRV